MGNRKEKRSFSLYMLLVLLISGMTITSILLISRIFILEYSRSLTEIASTNSEQAVSQAAKTIEINENGMKNDLNLIISRLSKCDDMEEAADLISDMTYLRSNVVSVNLYDMDGTLLLDGSGGRKLKEGGEENLSFNKEIFAEAEDIAIMAPHVQNLYENFFPWVVTLGKKANIGLFEEPVYVAMDFNFTSIASYVDSVGIGQHGYCYIMDQDHTIVYHPQQQLIFSGIKMENNEKAGELPDGVYPGQDTITCIRTLKGGEWRIVGVSYTDELITDRLASLKGFIFRIAVVLIILAVFIGIVCSRAISGPVLDLVKAMKEFEASTEDYSYEARGVVSEVRTLSESFEHLVKMIKELMVKVKQEEISLRKTELKALQAQINPHFLYNTLDSIQWMCEQGKTPDAVKMVGALARLFRISISHGRELITIADEINHAKSYLVIQSYRYKNQFTYEFEIEEGISSYYCNKITLQPMIENAIYHGIGRNVDEGLIRISAKLDDDIVEFRVSDNGAGMTQEQCENILKKERSDSSGIGIKNVNDRIKIFFGDEYGITIESELDEGTTIIIRFPKIEEDTYEAK